MKAKDTSKICWSDFFYYDESSPTFLRNKISKVGVKQHSVAGTLSKRSGYAFVKYLGSIYPVHRIVWELMVGNIHSDLCIDHLDGDRKK